MKKIVFVLVITMFLDCKTEQQLPKNFDYGSIENAVYSNNYFKMRVPFDDSWFAKSQEDMEDTAKAGRALIKSNSYKDVLEASKINNAYLFTLNQYGPDELIAYNPSLSIVAENTAMYPEVTRGRAYLEEVQNVLNQMTINYEFDMVDEEFMMGKHRFYAMDIYVDYLGLDIKQRYYTTISKGFSLSIILSYTTGEQLAKLESMFHSIVFSEGISKKKS